LFCFDADGSSLVGRSNQELEVARPHKLLLLFEGESGEQSWPLVLPSARSKQTLINDLKKQWMNLFKLDLMIIEK
jgi:hypothetical protein